MNHWLILLGHQPAPISSRGRKVRPLDEVQKSRTNGRPPHPARLIHPDGSIQEFTSMAELARCSGISHVTACYVALDGLPDEQGRRIEWVGEPPESKRINRPVKVMYPNGSIQTYANAVAASKATGMRLATIYNKLSQGSPDAKGRRYRYAD